MTFNPPSTVGKDMSDEKVYLQEQFFKFLVSLEELKEKKEINLFLSSLGISEIDFENYQKYLMEFKVLVLTDSEFIYPLEQKIEIKLNLNLSEWLALQVSIDKTESYQSKLIKNKFEKVKMLYSQFIITKKNELMRTRPVQDNLKKKIERSLRDQKALKFRFLNNSYKEIFPLRITFIEGLLCLIGEDVEDKSLSFFSLSEIAKIDDEVFDYVPHLSQLEVNEFINNIRLVSGNEERLVLKIYSPTESDLLPEYHFLGNPFITSNPEGDFIWAASIEMCEDTYEWLYRIKDKEEILDPGHIKKEFSQYCEIIKENNFYKKTS
jgi:hypothetical protein